MKTYREMFPHLQLPDFQIDLLKQVSPETLEKMMDHADTRARLRPYPVLPCLLGYLAVDFVLHAARSQVLRGLEGDRASGFAVCDAPTNFGQGLVIRRLQDPVLA